MDLKGALATRKDAKGAAADAESAAPMARIRLNQTQKTLHSRQLQAVSQCRQVSQYR
jgi:hypothetical protein